MNLILVRASDVDAGGRAILRGARARHVAGVIAARPGDRLRVGVVRGAIGHATVAAVDDAEVALELDRALVAGAPTAAPPEIDLVLALPRPKVLSRALETAASFGVRRIDLVNAWRVDKAYFSSSRLDPAALERDLWRGCEQGGTTWLPDIDIHRLLVPWLGELEASADPAARRLLAHPASTRGVEQALGPDRRGERAVVAIGPEGGWIESELASFARLEFEPVSIGARVLRVEAAIAALLSQIELVRRLPAAC